MKSAKYILYILVLLSVTGCGGGGYRTAIVKTRFVSQNNTVHLPLLVDIVIDDARVSNSYSCRTDYGLEYAKTQAVAGALKKTGADILYEPMYQIENTGSMYNIEVTGHTAHYKNFRQPKLPFDSTGAVSRVNNIVQPVPVIVNSKSKKQ